MLGDWWRDEFHVLARCVFVNVCVCVFFPLLLTSTRTLFTQITHRHRRRCQWLTPELGSCERL